MEVIFCNFKCACSLVIEPRFASAAPAAPTLAPSLFVIWHWKSGCSKCKSVAATMLPDSEHIHIKDKFC